MRTHILVPCAVVFSFAAFHCSGGGDSGGPPGGHQGTDGGSSSGSTSYGDGGVENEDSGTTSSSGGSASSSGGTTSSSGGKADGGTKGDGGTVSTGNVTFSIDMSKGPARQFQAPAKPVPVSPYVYGVQAFSAWEKKTKWGFLRVGGDAMTPWNWTNNYSNSASDYCFWQGQEAGGSALAGSITAQSGGFPISTAQSLGIGYLATVPIVDFVSATFSNNTGINGLCPGNPSCGSGQTARPYSVNSGNLSFASTNASSPAFVGNAPSKPGGNFCTCEPSGGTCAAGGCAPSTTGAVYQDEFANFLKVKYGAGAAPVFLSLDNEPNYWPGTHPELWPYTGTPGCGTSGTVSFDDIVNRNATYSAALKKAWPGVKVFGPVVAQDGIVYGGDYSDPNLPTTFTDYYLSKMAAASATAGTPLLDVFDIHYYTQGQSPSQCLQTPRMFWDPSFKDFTAAQTDGIDFGWSGQNNFFDTSLFPRQMIPRLLGKISSAYSGKGTAAPGLSFSEYNPGCEDSIEGGVAEADLLGIFGREGVFAASVWPMNATLNGSGQLIAPLIAAYESYRNYDGNGSVVGDTTVNATTSNVEETSVYAFAHSTDASAVDVVAINKTSGGLTATIKIANAPALKGATLYALTGAKVAVVPVSGTAPAVACSGGTCTLTYTMPALSVTTMILR